MARRNHFFISLASVILLLIAYGYSDDNPAAALYSGLNSRFGSQRGSTQEQFQKITVFVQNNAVPISIAIGMLLVLFIATKKRKPPEKKSAYSFVNTQATLRQTGSDSSQALENSQAEEPAVKSAGLTKEETDLIESFILEPEKKK